MKRETYQPKHRAGWVPPECQCLNPDPHDGPHEWHSLTHRWTCPGRPAPMTLEEIDSTFGTTMAAYDALFEGKSS